jgi:hypothetical protein
VLRPVVVDQIPFGLGCGVGEPPTPPAQVLPDCSTRGPAGPTLSFPRLTVPGPAGKGLIHFGIEQVIGVIADSLHRDGQHDLKDMPLAVAGREERVDIRLFRKAAALALIDIALPSHRLLRW